MNSTGNSFSAHITENTVILPAVQAWKFYLGDQGRSPHTLKAFSADLMLLESFFPNDKPIGQIGTQDLEDFLSWLEKERGVPCSPKTLSRRITSIKSFFRWLTQNGVLATDPSEKILQKTVISPLPTTLTRKECDRALEIANGMRTSANPDPRPYVLMLLLLETALKKGECLSLMTNHLEIDGPEGSFVFVRYSSPRYRYKERKIPVSWEWTQAYREYAQRYQIKYQVFPWSQRRLEYLLEDVSKIADFDKHISFDMLRWTSALNALLNGTDSDKIRQNLGISKIQWREVYQKLRNLALEQGYDLENEPVVADNHQWGKI